MEGIEKQLRISFLGTGESSGNTFVSLNFACDILARNYSVLYTTPEEDQEIGKIFKSIKAEKGRNGVAIHSTSIDRLDLLTITHDFDSRYSEKMDGIISGLERQPDIVIHNIQNPLASPYNRFLSLSDLLVMVMKIESTSVSDYFNLMKKMMMLEKNQAGLFLVFNNTKDLERAFEIYQKILKESEDFNISVLPVFTGIIPGDPLRQSRSIRRGVPLRILFPECGISGALSFLGDRVLKKLEDRKAPYDAQ